MSIVPHAKRPASARARSAASCCKQPAELGRGEIRVEDEAGVLSNPVLIRPVLAAEIRGAPILPDDGAGHGRPVSRSQSTTGFALIGDADGGELPGSNRRGGEGARGVTSRTEAQISSASCSTQPGCG